MFGGKGVAVTEWEPATETEAAMRDALRGSDQELYFRILARTELLLPVSAQALAGQVPMGWGTWTTGGRTHVLAFTSVAAVQACLAENAGSTRRTSYRELAAAWPNHEWWLAVNPGLPIEGYLPAWFVAQLSQGDVRLPGRPIGARARLEQVESAARARATAAVPAHAPSDAQRSAPPSYGEFAGLPAAMSSIPGPGGPGSYAAPPPTPFGVPLPPAALPGEPVSAALVGPTSEHALAAWVTATASPPVADDPSGGGLGHQPGVRHSTTPTAAGRKPTTAGRAAEAFAAGRAAQAGRSGQTSAVPADRDRLAAAAASGAVTSPDGWSAFQTRAPGPAPSPGPPPPAAPGPMPPPTGTPAPPAVTPEATAPPAPAMSPPAPMAPTSPGTPEPTGPEAASPQAGAAETASPSPALATPGPAPSESATSGSATSGSVSSESVTSGSGMPGAPASGAGVTSASVDAAAPDAAAPGASPPAPPASPPRFTPAAPPAGEPSGDPSPAGSAPSVATPTIPGTAPTNPAAIPTNPTAPTNGAIPTGASAAGNGAALGTGSTAGNGSSSGYGYGYGSATSTKEFTPANDVERSLLAATGEGRTDSYLSTLLLAKVLLPVSQVSFSGARPGEEGFTWRTEKIDGATYVTVFTSPERLADYLGSGVETVIVKFAQLIQRWPQNDWSFAVNPGTPVGARFPGSQIVALANWATEAGLDVETDGGPGTVGGAGTIGGVGSNGGAPGTAETGFGPAAEAVPVARSGYATTRRDPAQPTIMQKTVAPDQVGYYLERGYDRVSGFVHRAGEIAHLDTPAKLYAALGLGYQGSPFARNAAEVYLLRWPAYRPSLYRIPYGGQNEAAMRAMEGWVIERPPFRGNGFAPGENSDVVAEFKVDSVRLPHGSQLCRLGADGTVTLLAVLDADARVWRRATEV